MIGEEDSCGHLGAGYVDKAACSHGKGEKHDETDRNHREMLSEDCALLTLQNAANLHKLRLPRQAWDLSYFIQSHPVPYRCSLCGWCLGDF